MFCFYFFVICPLYFHELPANCGSNLDCDSLIYRAHLLHQIRVCGSSSNFCIFSHLWMGPGILGNYYFGHTDVMVLDKVVNYNHHIFGEVLHIVPVVDIYLGPPPLENNVHDLALNKHLFEHRVVGMEPVAAMSAALVEVDTLVVEVVGTVNTVEAVLLCVVFGFGQVGYLGFEQDSSCSSGFVAPKVFVVTRHCWRICLLHVSVDRRQYLSIV